MTNYDLLAKLVIIGDVSVGKTSLINRFAKNEFAEDHVYTMGVDYSRLQCRVSDKTVLAELRDTAGQERFRAITSSVFRGANGVVIVYDITDEETFVSVESFWVKFAKENMVEDIPIIIVGNKSDMEKERKVPRERGQVLAINEGTMFMEVSAKNNKCVESCFTEVVKRIIYLGSMNSTYSRSSRGSTFALSASSPYQRYSQLPDGSLLYSVPETAEDSIPDTSVQGPQAVIATPLSYVCC